MNSGVCAECGYLIVILSRRQPVDAQEADGAPDRCRACTRAAATLTALAGLHRRAQGHAPTPAGEASTELWYKIVRDELVERFNNERDSRRARVRAFEEFPKQG